MIKHKDDGERCLVAHESGIQCIKCCRCGEFIRPEDMEDKCDGPRKFTEKPFPGSKEAEESGCICPVQENALFIVRVHRHCKVHGLFVLEQ